MFILHVSKKKILLILAIFLLLIIFLLGIKYNRVIGKGKPTQPFILPPTEVPATYIVNFKTATPNNTQMARRMGTVYPTPTEFVISKYTDLSPSLKDDDKFIVTVRHPDGNYEVIKIGPIRPENYNGIFPNNALPSYIASKTPTQSGDVIISWQPPVPFRITKELIETLTLPTLPIYPTNKPIRLPTQNAYPYP